MKFTEPGFPDLWKELINQPLEGGTIEMCWAVGFGPFNMDHLRGRITEFSQRDGRPSIICYNAACVFHDNGQSRHPKTLIWKACKGPDSEGIMRCHNIPSHIPADVASRLSMSGLQKKGGAYGFVARDQATRVAIYPPGIRVPKHKLFFGTGIVQLEEFQKLAGKILESLLR